MEKRKFNKYTKRIIRCKLIYIITNLKFRFSNLRSRSKIT